MGELRRKTTNQMKKGRHTPPYTDERNHLKNPTARRPKAQNSSRDFAFVTTQWVTWFSGICWGAYEGLAL